MASELWYTVCLHVHIRESVCVGVKVSVGGMWIEEGGKIKMGKVNSHSCGFEVIGSLHSRFVEENDTCNLITFTSLQPKGLIQLVYH